MRRVPKEHGCPHCGSRDGFFWRATDCGSPSRYRNDVQCIVRRCSRWYTLWKDHPAYIQ